MSPDLLRDTVVALLPGATVFPPDDARGQVVFVVERAAITDALTTLRHHPDLRFEVLTDLTAVDYLGRVPRFEVIYQLYSLTHNHRLRVKVPLAEESLELPSATPLWKSANWAERETFDMFGVRFTGHPDLRRILMYPEFVGHPLRKDYPLHRRQPLVPERDPLGQPYRPRTPSSS